MTNGNIDFTKIQANIHYPSVLVRMDFLFLVYNPLEECDFYFQTFAVNTQQSMAANVKAFLAQTAELKYTYRQVNILIHTARYTSVPLELFEDSRWKLSSIKNFRKQNNEIILCNVLGKSNLVILFYDRQVNTFVSVRTTS